MSESESAIAPTFSARGLQAGLVDGYDLPPFVDDELSAIEEASVAWVRAWRYATKGGEKVGQGYKLEGENADSILKRHGISLGYRRRLDDGTEIRFCHVETAVRIRAFRMIGGERNERLDEYNAKRGKNK